MSSERERVNRSFKSMGLLCHHLPLRMDNGASMPHLDARCGGCHERIKTALLKGEIQRSWEGHRITALGYCLGCNMITPFMYDIEVHDATYTATRDCNWKGWSEGEIVEVDFRKEVDPTCDV
jgi:hypothetical protein